MFAKPRSTKRTALCAGSPSGVTDPCLYYAQSAQQAVALSARPEELLWLTLPLPRMAVFCLRNTHYREHKGFESTSSQLNFKQFSLAWRRHHMATVVLNFKTHTYTRGHIPRGIVDQRDKPLVQILQPRSKSTEWYWFCEGNKNVQTAPYVSFMGTNLTNHSVAPFQNGMGFIGLWRKQKCSKKNQIPVPRDAIEVLVRDDSWGLKVNLVTQCVSIVDSWAYNTARYRAVAF